MGNFVLLGASLLGAVSCLLVAWSLWSRNQARKRARAARLAQQQGQQQQQQQQQQLAPAFGHQGPPPGDYGDPRTQILASDELFDNHEVPTQFMTEEELLAEAAGGGREVPTQFMSDEDLFGQPTTRPTVVLGGAASYADQDDHELPTQFMTEEELLAEARHEPTHELPPGQVQDYLGDDDTHELPTQFMTEEELRAAADQDEHEQPTQFMTDAELHGGAASGEFRVPGHLRGRKRSEETVVLSDDAILEVPEEPAGWVQSPDGFAVAPPAHQHADRPPVHRIPLPPPEAAPAPAPARAQVQRTAAAGSLRAPAPGRQPARPAAKPSAPAPIPSSARMSPAKAAPIPAASPSTPASRPSLPKAMPPSRLPPEHGAAVPAGRVNRLPPPASPARPLITGQDPDAPQKSAQAVSQGFGAFVGAPIDDDDDDDDDDADPETELVHQAELLRLMQQIKPPGSK